MPEPIADMLLDELDDSVALYESDGTIVHVNRTTARLFGKSREELVGHRLWDLFPDAVGNPFWKQFQHVAQTGEPSTFDNHYEPWNRRFENNMRRSGTRICVIARDVTELVAANREAIAARAAAETASRAKDEFLAMLGHELRNPLSPILTALHLMRMRGQESREQAVIERQVAHLIRLVDDLLDISRITRGKLELRKEPVELSAAVATGIEMARPLLEQKKQRLEVDVPATGLALEGDLNRLGQVVSNLLTNAAKYSDPGTVVRVSAARRADLLTLRIRDEGIGIAREMLDRIFDVLYQQPQSLERSTGGLGLGLAIVRSLVEMHGGTVTARSEGVGKGSELLVEFPALSRHHAARSGPDVEIVVDPSLLAAPGAKKVLIVDDNVDAANGLGDLLGALGYQVRVAHEAVTALKMAAGFAPDFCLLDIGLPVMDGYELAARLRESGALAAGARMIAVTGYGQDADKAKAAAAGFDEHIVKPASVDVLTKALRAGQ